MPLITPRLHGREGMPEMPFFDLEEGGHLERMGAAKGGTLPEQFDAIGWKLRIAGDNGEIIRQRLCYDQTIKRVIVMERQPSMNMKMRNQNGKSNDV